MEKSIKMLLVLFIVLIIFACISTVYATGVNMNLSNNTDTTTYNSILGSNVVTHESITDLVANPANSSVDTLTLSDMINIVLCAIGVILILLGIAIIIRQKVA